jgi:hypothetical protein
MAPVRCAACRQDALEDGHILVLKLACSTRMHPSCRHQDDFLQHWVWTVRTEVDQVFWAWNEDNLSDVWLGR